MFLRASLRSIPGGSVCSSRRHHCAEPRQVARQRTGPPQRGAAVGAAVEQHRAAENSEPEHHRGDQVQTAECDNSANAYYKFTGATVGSVFNVNQGQISFYLKSRQSFAQRLASATSYRQVFDVRDANTHLFQFNTQAVYGYLLFSYTLAGASNYYIPPPGTEEALFGNGITLKVTMTWDGSVAKLYLNDTLVQQSPYATPTPNWSAASNFDFGAYEYLTSGGYDSCDDIIDEFTVTGASPVSCIFPISSTWK